MPCQIGIGELTFDFQNARGRAVSGKIIQQVKVFGLHADQQFVRPEIVKQHPHHCPAVTVAFFQRVLDAAQIGQCRVLFVKEVFDRGHIGDLPDTFKHPFGHMPFLAHHDQQFAFAA